MINKYLITFLLIFIFKFSYAQEEDLLIAYTIPLELKTKANAVVRFDDIDIEVKAYNKMIYRNKRIITILNKYGDNDHGAYASYDENISIKKMEARVYDAIGKEIKKIKKNDFTDESAVSGGTLFSDSRVKYLNYTPINYPYTIVFEIEVEYNSTAFVPGWRPIEGFYVSTQNADYEIINNSDVEVKIKTSNFENYGIEKLSNYHYIASNLKAIKPEAYSPSFKSYAPFLKAALKEFDMEGVRGVNNNWEDFGKWMHDNLLIGTTELPEGAIKDVKNLTNGVEDKLEKAKIVYNYMQDKTRYISVQVGIGGWKPMLASDVDRLGYADCKGLTNYTKALLDEVGVESYYTVVYGSRDIRNMDSEFSATEGNHVILTVPNNDDYVWLECTSQTNPFGYISNFTDDRDVLLVTPEGGKIVHTKSYSAEESLQKTKAIMQLDRDGNITAEVSITTEGFQYDLHEGTQLKTLKKQKLHIKEYWDNINNLIIEKISFNNDKDSIIFKEELSIKAQSYAVKSGNRLLFQPNAFNKVTHIPTRYKNRTLDFEIKRGFTDKDEFIIKLPSELSIEAMPNDVLIETKFGSYSFLITKLSENELLYKRTYILNKGYYPKEEYKAFRDFRKQIVKHDKSKIVLVNKS